MEIYDHTEHPTVPELFCQPPAVIDGQVLDAQREEYEAYLRGEAYLNRLLEAAPASAG